MYKQKYLKYKQKYIILKKEIELHGGDLIDDLNITQLRIIRNYIIRKYNKDNKDKPSIEPMEHGITSGYTKIQLIDDIKTKFGELNSSITNRSHFDFNKLLNKLLLSTFDDHNLHDSLVQSEIKNFFNEENFLQKIKEMNYNNKFTLNQLKYYFKKAPKEWKKNYRSINGHGETLNTLFIVPPNTLLVYLCGGGQTLYMETTNDASLQFFENIKNMKIYKTGDYIFDSIIGFDLIWNDADIFQFSGLLPIEFYTMCIEKIYNEKIPFNDFKTIVNKGPVENLKKLSDNNLRKIYNIIKFDTYKLSKVNYYDIITAFNLFKSSDEVSIYNSYKLSEIVWYEHRQKQEKIAEVARRRERGNSVCDYGKRPRYDKCPHETPCWDEKDDCVTNNNPKIYFIGACRVINNPDYLKDEIEKCTEKYNENCLFQRLIERNFNFFQNGFKLEIDDTIYTNKLRRQPSISTSNINNMYLNQDTIRNLLKTNTGSSIQIQKDIIEDIDKTEDIPISYICKILSIYSLELELDEIIMDNCRIRRAIKLHNRPKLSDYQDKVVPNYGNIEDWDTSQVTDMHDLFKNDALFDKDISRWNTSNVINMKGMFEGASEFNKDISKWNTSNVINMEKMFKGASKFNININTITVNENTEEYIAWDVSNVTDMSFMFYDAILFNGIISNWDTSSVLNMSHMFYNCYVFNQSINTEFVVIGNNYYDSWDVSNVTNMDSMLYNTYKFSQNIHDWTSSNVIYRDNFSSGSEIQSTIEHLPIFYPYS